MKRILITGAAGFIGFHLTKRIINQNNYVVGIDNINDYYDVNLKYSRLEETGIKRENIIGWNKEVSSDLYSNYKFIKTNIQDKSALDKIFKQYKFDVVINLAAQAGVRYSIEKPDIYIESNITGFFNVLECCRFHKIKHLLYASSSSVYGENKKVPFSTEHSVDKPISLYAATKKSNELMAFTYSHLYNIPTTGLRFFTVYGPWGRPDMAIFLFVKSVLDEKPIKVFNNGNMKRDFTYIDDIINGVEIALNNPPEIKENQPAYTVANLGNGKPESLMDFIEAIENSTQKMSIRNYLPIQDGDVSQTWSNNEFLNKLGYKSNVGIKEGINNFVKWFKEYYKYN